MPTHDFPRDVKLAAALPGVHELIRRRWSPRAFSERPVSRQDLQVLFDAARWAPSCFNEQPWRFLFVTKADPEAYARLLGCLVESNQSWAKTAPVLMVTAGKRTFSHNGAPDVYGLHDAGIALAFLMLQATEMGLYVHAMGGYDRDRTRTEYAIPDDYELGAAVAIGYPGDPAMLSPKQQQAEVAPRTRKPLTEIVFEAAWAAPAVF